jgi:hypothetical protein
VYIHIYTHIHGYTYIFTYTYMCKYTYIYIHMYIHTYIYIHICIYIYIDKHIQYTYLWIAYSNPFLILSSIYLAPVLTPINEGLKRTCINIGTYKNLRICICIWINIHIYIDCKYSFMYMDVQIYRIIYCMQTTKFICFWYIIIYVNIYYKLI